MKPIILLIKRTVSQGRETKGYNVFTLIDTAVQKKYQCNGGGYDMLGTVFGRWLQETYQERLMRHKDKAHYHYTSEETVTNKNPARLYGMVYSEVKGCVMLDGAYGLESMQEIAKVIGLEVYSFYVDGVTGVFTVIDTVEVK